MPDANMPPVPPALPAPTASFRFLFPLLQQSGTTGRMGHPSTSSATGAPSSASAHSTGGPLSTRSTNGAPSAGAPSTRGLAPMALAAAAEFPHATRRSTSISPWYTSLALHRPAQVCPPPAPVSVGPAHCPSPPLTRCRSRWRRRPLARLLRPAAHGLLRLLHRR